MSVKEENEITVKVECPKEELIKCLKDKGFTKGRMFSLDDYFYILENLHIENMTAREIIAKAVIIRYILSDILIEVETEENTAWDTIEKIKNIISKIKIPIKKDEYFVKKAEIELNKILETKN